MEYTFKTRQMVEVSEKIGKKHDIEMAIYDNDIEKLAILISIFGNVKEDEAYDYIDEQLENKKTINDLYKEIIKGINEKGFFKEKLQANMELPPIDMEKIIKSAMDEELDKMKTLKNM